MADEKFRISKGGYERVVDKADIDAHYDELKKAGFQIHSGSSLGTYTVSVGDKTDKTPWTQEQYDKNLPKLIEKYGDRVKATPNYSWSDTEYEPGKAKAAQETQAQPQQAAEPTPQAEPVQEQPQAQPETEGYEENYRPVKLDTETDPNALRRRQQAATDINQNPAGYAQSVASMPTQRERDLYHAERARAKEESAKEEMAEHGFLSNPAAKGEAKRRMETYRAVADKYQKAADLSPQYQQEKKQSETQLDDIEKRIGELSDALVGDTPRPDPRMGASYNLTAGNTIASKMTRSKEGRNLIAASNLIDEARMVLNRGNRYTDDMGKMEAFGNATLETLAKPEFWTMGLSTISDGKRIREIQEKVVNAVGSLSKEDIEAGNLEKVLSPDELAVMEAYLAWGDAQILRAHNQSKGYKAGEIGAQSIAFMRDMMMTAGITKGVNTAVKKLFSGWVGKTGRVFAGLGGNAVSKWATAEGLNYAQKLGRGAVDLMHKSVKNLVASGIDAAVAVNFTPTLYANYSKQLWTPDENNMLKTKGEIWNENWWQNWKEYFTERGIGEAPGKVLGHVGKTTGATQFISGLAGEKVAGFAKKYARALRTGKMATAGAFNNVGEYFEEYVGALMDKYLFGQKTAMVDFWDKENLATMVGAFAPMMGVQAISAGVNVAALNKADRRFEKRKEALRYLASENMGFKLPEETWKQFFDFFDTKVSGAESAMDYDVTGDAMVAEIKKMHNIFEAEVLNGGGMPLSPQEQEELFRAEFDLFKAAAEHNAVQAAYEDQQAEKRQAKRDEIQQSLGGKQFWLDADDETGDPASVLIWETERGPAYSVGSESLSRRERREYESNEDIYPVVFQDGSTGFINGSEITGAQRYTLDEYLDQQVNADQAVKDAASQQEQELAQVDALKSQFQIGVPGPINGLVPTDILDDGIIFEDGTEMTWEQVGQALGQPIQTLTEDEAAEAEAGADAAREDENERLEVVINQGLKKKSLIQDGSGKTWNVVQVLPGTIDQETGKAKFLLKDEAGNYQQTELDYNEFIDPDMSEPGEGAAEPAPVEAPVQPNAPQGGSGGATQAPAEPEYQIPRTEEGDIDFDKMLDENPAAYAAEMDKALGESGETAKAVIGERIKALDKQIEEATKKGKSNEIVRLRTQKKRYQDVLDSYDKPVQGAQDTNEVPTFQRLLGDGLSFSDISAFVNNQLQRLTQMRGTLEKPVFDGVHLKKWEDETAEYNKNLSAVNGLISHFDGMKSITDRVEEAVYDTDIASRPLTREELEPKNATELAAQMFSRGYYLTIDSYNSELIARGTDATGQTGENRAMIGLFRKPENGGHTIAQAAERLIEMKNEGYEGSQFSDEDARDIILDLLSSVRTYQELKDYITVNRREQLRQEEDYAYGQMAEDIQRRYGMTVEQYKENLDDLRLDYLAQLLENGGEIPTFEENEDNGTVPETETDGVLPEEQGGAEPGTPEGPGMGEAGGSAEQTDTGAGPQETGDGGSDGAPGVLGGPEEGSGAVETDEEDMTDFGSEEAPAAEEPEAPVARPSLTPEDIIEIYNNTAATKAADKGKNGRVEILNALYQANPNIVEFRNEQDQLNAIEDVVELARKYPDLAISQEILSRLNETPASEEAPAPEAEAETEKETSETEQNTEENPSESEENVVTSQEEEAPSEEAAAGEAEAETEEQPEAETEAEPQAEAAQEEIPGETRPLTEDEIRNSGYPDADIIESAVDYIKGSTGFSEQIAYQNVLEYVRSQRTTTEQTGVNANGTQLDGPVVQPAGVAADGGRTEGDGLAGGESGPGQEGGSTGTQGSGIPSGEGRPASTQGVGLPTDVRNSGSERPGGRTQSNEPGEQRDDVRGGQEAVPQSNEQAADRGIDAGSTDIDALGGELADLLEQFKNTSFSVDRKIPGVGETVSYSTAPETKQEGALSRKQPKKPTVPLSLEGMTPQQMQIAGKVIFTSAKLGYAYAKTEGLTSFNDFRRWFISKFGDAVKAGLNYNESSLDALIREVWNTKLKIGEERLTLEQHASNLHNQELRDQGAIPVADKKELQKKANNWKGETIPASRKNIREALPVLIPGQWDDVVAIERQFFDPSHNDYDHAFGKGMLITNGTGTGKTFTGMGVIKRFVNMGKKRILLVAPASMTSDGANSWIDTAKLFGVKMTKLKDTKDKGEGVVITSYENFRENHALYEDEFDLVVYDECQNIIENQKGEDTLAYEAHKRITNKNVDEATERLAAISEPGRRLYELEQEKRRLDNESKKKGIKESRSKEIAFRLEEIDIEMDDLRKQVKLLKPSLREKAEASVGKTKVLLLSATPFNTVKNLRYAEGYVFQYPKVFKSDGTEVKDEQARESAFTNEWFRGDEPMEDMEIAFGDHLLDELETASFRELENGYDHSRDFPDVSGNVMAARFNQAWQAIQKDPRFSSLKDFTKFLTDPIWTTQLFETMKISALRPRLKEHLDAGRKIVIFHDRVNETKASDTRPAVGPPFDTVLQLAMLGGVKQTGGETVLAISTFRREFADILAWEKTLDYRPVHEQIIDFYATDADRAQYAKEKAEYEKKLQEWNKECERIINANPTKSMDEIREMFPKEPKKPSLKAESVAIYNGECTNAEKDKAKAEFNDDNSKKKIICVTTRSGGAGLSLHDTTGKHPRVMIQTALPISPIGFIQAEGRIFRFGNRSNAIFEYPRLGIDLEAFVFAMNFNAKAETVENLAHGFRGRGLKSSIMTGFYENSGNVPIDGQGIGGVDMDKRGNTLKGMAKARHDYGVAKRKGIKDGDSSVPEPVGYAMAQWAKAVAGDQAIIPFAGRGSISRYLPKGVSISALEDNMSLQADLMVTSGGADFKIREGLFGELNPINKADVILLNGSFDGMTASSLGSFEKGFQHLSEGGRLVAIIPDDARADESITKLGESALLRTTIKIGKGTLEGNEENLRIVVIDKVSSEKMRAKATAPTVTDLSNVGQDELFNLLESVTVPERLIDKQYIAMKKISALGTELRKNPLLDGADGFFIYENKGNIRGPLFGFRRKSRSGPGMKNARLSFDSMKLGSYWYREKWWNAYLSEFENPSQSNVHIQQYKAMKEILEMDDESFRKWAMIEPEAKQENVEALRDLIRLYQKFFRAAFGLTDSQIQRVSEGLRAEVSASDIDTLNSYDELKAKFEACNNGDEERQDMYDKVEKVARQIGLIIGTEVMGRDFLGGYNNKDNTLKINTARWNGISDDQRATTLLHELIHSVTVYAIAGYNVDAPGMTDGLYNSAKLASDVYEQITKGAAEDVRPFTGQYSIENAKELLAEMANNETKEKLKNRRMWVRRSEGRGIRVSGAEMEGGEQTTAWDLLTEALDGMLKNFDKSLFDRFKGRDNAFVWQIDRNGEYTRPAPVEEKDKGLEPIETGQEEVTGQIIDDAAIVERADQLAGKFGIKLQGAPDLKGKARFNTATGTIEVNYGAHDSVEDVEQTIFHEVVGHLGLRKMFGRKFDDFLGDVYIGAHESIRQQIDAMREQLAREKRARGENPSTSLGEATEEYLAELAEDGVGSELEQSLWQRIKQAFFDLLRRAGFNIPLTDEDLMYVLWQSKRNLENTDRLSILELADRALMRDALRRQAESSHNQGPEDNGPFDDGGGRYRPVRDRKKIEELESGPKKKVYRSMQLINGLLYPPMSARVGGELRSPSTLGEWEESEEHPELADKDGNFKLDKGNGKSLPALYAPYFHSRLSPLNEQFSEAYNRPNLVIVEGEVPESELTSGYTAEGSKKSVGEHDWPSGKVSNALAKKGANTRKVILSRWFKPVRIVPNSEVADIIADTIKEYGADISFPYNVVTPGLRKELSSRGIQFDGWQGNRPKNWEQIVGEDNETTGNDEELLSIKESAVKNGTFMKAPNGNPSKLTEKQWLQVRTKAFKKWFGDWEIAAETTPIYQSKGTFNTLDEAEDWAKENLQGQKRTNRFTGEDISIGRRSIKEMLGEKAVKGSESINAHLSALRSVLDFIETGIPGEIHEDTHGRGFDVMRLFNAIEIGDKLYRVKSTVKKVSNGDRYYTYEVQEMELMEERRANRESEEQGSVTTNNSNNSIVGAKLLKGVKKTNSSEDILDYSRIVDENGEPRVLYHGTKMPFWEFDGGKSRGVFTDGLNYLALDREFADDWASRDDEKRRPAEVNRVIEEAEKKIREHRRELVDLIKDKYGTADGYVDRPEWTEYWENRKQWERDNLDLGGMTLDEARRRLGLRVLGLFVNARNPYNPAEKYESEGKQMLIDLGELERAPERMSEYYARGGSYLYYEKKKVVDELKKRGYDAIYLSENVWSDQSRNLRTLAVWDAERIKSATDNEGTFDKDNPDIRYRSLRHKPKSERIKRTIIRNTTTDEENDIALNAYERAANNVFTRFGESFIDMMNSLTIARDAMVKESGREMKDSEDFITAFNTMSSRMHAMSQKFVDKQLKALTDAIKDITDEFEDIESQDISRYVAIKSGLERNIEFAKRDAREWYQEEFRKAVEKVKADKKLADDEKQAKIDELQKELEDHLQAIKDGTDEKFLEYRKDDYGGITGWMSRYEDHAGNPIDELPEMDPNETEAHYNARIRKMRHPLPGADDLAGAEALAEAEVADFEEKISQKRADALWKSINDCTKHILRTQYKSNVISKAQFDSLIDRLQYYVPLRGFDEKTAGDLYSYYGADESKSFVPPLLRAGGRISRPDSPFGYIASMADSAFSAAAKNDAKRTLYRFVANRKDNSFATIADSYYRKTGRQNAKGGDIYQAVNAYTEINPDTGKPYITDGMPMNDQREGFAKFKADMLADPDVIKGKKNLNLRDSVAMITKSQEESHIVRVKVLGEEYEMVFHGNPRMAQAINGELNSDANDNVLKRVIRFLASMSTSRNPAFWIDNFRRDFITSLVNLGATEDAGYVAKVTANLKHAFRTVQLYMNNGEIKKAQPGTKLSELETLWNQYVENGAITGWTVISRHDRVDKQIEEFTKTGRWHGQDESWIVKHSGAVGDWIKKVGDFGESIEQIIRFATFMTSRQMGRGINQSIKDAKEVTVNFNRKGSGKAITKEEAKKLGYYLPNGKWHKLSGPEQMIAVLFSSLAPIGRNVFLFFNANMQGLYRQVQNFKTSPVKTSLMMGGLTMMGFAYTFLTGLLGGGGDDDDKEYLKISEYNRNHKFAVPTFWNEDLFFLWPVPPEFAPFYEIGNIWGEAALKRRPDQNPVMASLAAMGELLPANPAEPTSLIPAQAKPIVEAAMNRDYMGRKLYNKNQWNKNLPGYTKAYNSTWDWLVRASEIANTISGGDYATKGWLNFNPAVAQQLISGFGGGLLTFLGQIVNTAEAAIGDKPMTLRNAPLVNRFFLDTDEYMRDTYVNTEYYYFKDIADKTQERLKGYHFNKPDEDYIRVQKVLDSKDYQYLELYNEYKKEIDAYQKDINHAPNIEEKKQLSAEQDELKKAFVDECIEIFYSKE